MTTTNATSSIATKTNFPLVNDIKPIKLDISTLEATTSGTSVSTTVDSNVPPILELLPAELIELVLVQTNLSSVCTFSATCRLAHQLVHQPKDQHLWRHLFLLHPFDDPRRALRFTPTLKSKPNNEHQGLDSSTVQTRPQVIEWKALLRLRMLARASAFNHPQEMRKRNRALEVFISLVEGALPVDPDSSQYEPSYNLIWLYDVLKRSRILDAAPSPGSPPDYLQARLRSCLALTLDPKATNKEMQAKLRALRLKSLSFTYNVLRYNSNNNWGPCTSQGNVNWISVEHLVNVVLMNLREQTSPQGQDHPPIGLEFTRAYSAPATFSETDWAGITGSWRRYVCFIDYQDISGPYEAIRLIKTTLRPVERSSLRYFRPDSLGEPPSIDPRCPALHFSGSGKGSVGGSAIIEGRVFKTTDNNIRWQFVSAYDGIIQWSSDGVQIGNVGSAMGAVGVWTAATHENDDPFGPFWFWKVKDDDSATSM